MSTAIAPTVDDLAVMLLEPEYESGCTHNYHPDHDYTCERPARFVIVLRCETCGDRDRYLCGEHTSAYLPRYRRSGPWCPCSSWLPKHGHKPWQVTVRSV